MSIDTKSVGLTEAHVFLGTVTSAGYDGVQITGEWFSVPRSSTTPQQRYGNLLLELSPACELRKIAGHPFALSVLTPATLPNVANGDANNLLDSLVKNVTNGGLREYVGHGHYESGGGTRAGNLKAILDPCTVIASPIGLQEIITSGDPSYLFRLGFLKGDKDPDVPDLSRPPIDISYNAFMRNNTTGDGDLDMELHFSEWFHSYFISRLEKSPRFLAGFISADQVEAKLLGREGAPTWPIIHCETVMYARPTDLNDGWTQAQYDADQPNVRLPGWADSAGNAVLFNGIPLTSGNPPIADFEVVNGGDVDPNGKPQSGIALAARLPYWGKFRGRPIHEGDRLVITGMMVEDCGHVQHDYDFGLRYCYPDDSTIKDIEIHPVYSIDTLDASDASNFSGVWMDAEGARYYVVETNESPPRIFWYGTTPYGHVDMAHVFVGNIFPGIGGSRIAVGRFVDVGFGQRDTSAFLAIVLPPNPDAIAGIVAQVVTAGNSPLWDVARLTVPPYGDEEWQILIKIHDGSPVRVDIPPPP